MNHVLKSWPQFFEPLLAGDVSYDPRRNDRNYSRGDTVVLKEWVPERDAAHFGALGEYSGRQLEFTVSHVLRGFDDNNHFGLQAGFVILGLKPIKATYAKKQRKKKHHHAPSWK
jgi:hypothetical protein